MATLVLWLAGCVSSLEPPRVEDRVQKIYLIDHGRHPSLVLPDGQGGAVRYTYGDWTWFAEGETDLLDGIAALLWPTRAALGRQKLDAWESAATLRSEIVEGFVSLYALEVHHSAAVGLANRLDDVCFAGRDQAVANPRFSLTFVPHPEPYWFAHNSNVVMAGWLEELDVRVRGAALFSRWKVVHAGQEGR